MGEISYIKAMSFIPRAFKLQEHLQKNKVLILYGPRQVGKTTLINSFLSQTKLSYKLFTGDHVESIRHFSTCQLEVIKKMIGQAKILCIDEAQKIDNIGLALKIIVDHIPDLYVLVTGSSSFYLKTEISESLTGRKNILTLFPLSIKELSSLHTPYELETEIKEYLVYGMYPEVITQDSYENKRKRITEIAESYLMKDIFEFYKVRDSKPIFDLLKLLSFQIGNQVSTSELGKKLSLDNKTIARYLDLLEKAFVLFRLDGFSRNLRKEITKMSKYYFYDVGIRNALISNFNSLDKRDDIGQLWENFLVMERIKRNAYASFPSNYYFWKTYEKKEVDFVEERGGEIFGYELKWRSVKNKNLKAWQKAYPEANYELITSENFLDFIT